MRINTINEIVRDIELNPVENGGHVYHPIPFPEFSHLSTSSNSDEVYRKWALIENTMSQVFSSGLDGKKILDVGANAGFYTFSLAQKGARVTSFEPHPRYGIIGKSLAREKELDVDWYDKSFEYSLLDGNNFDITLMLSVFQWMADGGNKIDEAYKSIGKISEMSRFLIFELGYNKGKSCLNTNKFNHYAELIRMLKTNTVYRCFKFVGKTQLWNSTSRFLVLCSNDKRFDDTNFYRAVRMLNI